MFLFKKTDTKAPKNMKGARKQKTFKGKQYSLIPSESTETTSLLDDSPSMKKRR